MENVDATRVLKHFIHASWLSKTIIIRNNDYPKQFYSISINFLGRPRVCEYSGLTNAEKCKLYRAKRNSEDTKKAEALRKQTWRQNVKKDPLAYENYKLAERNRKRKNATSAQSSEEIVTDPEPTESPESSFTTKQTLHRSVSRVNKLLPKSPRKNVKVVEKLAVKYKVKFPFKKRG